MKHLPTSCGYISFIFRRVKQHQRYMPALSILSSRDIATLPRRPYQAKQLYRYNNAARWMSVARPMSGLISSDFIIRSPRPDLDIPNNLNCHELIFEKCDKYKDSIALDEYLTGRTYTYGQLKENAIKVANALLDMGIKKDDVILAFTTNTIDFPVLMLACSCLGVWFSAANSTYTAADLTRHMTFSDSKAMFVGEELIPVANEALKNPDVSSRIKTFVFGESAGYQSFHTLLQGEATAPPQVSINPLDDVHLLPFSSGTTGFPKGVMLTHNNIVANIMQFSEFVAKNGDNVLALLPQYHLFGMVGLLYMHFNSGAKLVVLPKFEPKIFLSCIQDKKINVGVLVPPLVIFLAKNPLVSEYDLSSLHRIICGAASLGEEVTTELRGTFKHEIILQQAYGLTEMSPGATCDSEFHPGSVGPLLSNTLGKVIDMESKERLGPGKDGELCLKGPQVMKGYYKNQEATDEMIDPEGWLHTGDVAYYNKNGVFYIKDRLKEMIKYKEIQVPPAELEALLISHEDVADVGVIGVPDFVAGELPKAFVVKKPGATISELDIVKLVEENMDRSKWLRGGVEFLDEIPRVPSGKILRRVLRERESPKKE